jgi:glycosyltransferase involved in cell wall biosynthesis
VLLQPPIIETRKNETTLRILQRIARANLGGEITVLGMVNDAELTDLMRAAAVVVQPSRFEGWSTVVQESKALGATVDLLGYSHPP